MSDQNKSFITQQGLEELKAELKYLIETRRPEITDRIKTARFEGDLSENADYAAAREEQGLLESRIREIENTLASAKIIETIQTPTKKRTKIIVVGSSITLAFLNKNGEEEKTEKIKIVGSIESNPFSGYISNECPLAKSIMNLSEGEIVEVKGASYPYKVKIIKIEN